MEVFGLIRVKNNDFSDCSAPKKEKKAPPPQLLKPPPGKFQRHLACGANYLAERWFNSACGANYPYQALKGGYFVFVWRVLS